jgi:hypothetical protein
MDEGVVDRLRAAALGPASKVLTVSGLDAIRENSCYASQPEEVPR